MKGWSNIFLIKPGSQKELVGELSANSLTAIEPPLWAGLMAAFLRKKGFFVEVIFMDGEKKSYENSIWDGHHS